MYKCTACISACISVCTAYVLLVVLVNTEIDGSC